MKKINTRKFPCDETNSMKTTECYNDFYMKKLNCSFPWMKDENKSYEKCGSNHKIKNLVELANKANIQDSKLMEELEQFGCTIPNCQEVTWRVSSSQNAGLGNLSHANLMALNFPSSTKVITL